MNNSNTTNLSASYLGANKDLMITSPIYRNKLL